MLQLFVQKKRVIKTLMVPTFSNQISKDINKYYPNCIDEEKTNKKLKIHISVVIKIIDSIKKKKQLPNHLIFHISTYIFHNPIELSTPLYQRVKNSQIYYGSFLLYGINNQNWLRIEVKKFWRKLQSQQSTIDKIMRFANHFDQFMNFKYHTIYQVNENYQQKLKLISENNNYFKDLFKIITKYKKDRIINQYVIKAFKQIMTKNILLINTQNNEQYMIIESSNGISEHLNQNHNKITKICLQNCNNKKKIQFGIRFQGNKMKIICDQHIVYNLTDRITKRGRQTLLKPQNLQEITLEDIFIQ